VAVDIPKKLNDKQRDLLKKLADEFGEEVNTNVKKSFWTR
jgi:DnaJ-class molecular chaperone